jgi:zinc transport system permease protein
MLDDFLVRAALAGLGVGLAAGPLGCFVVWRRMAYFGDATAHAAILGVALALFFNVSVFAGVLVISILVASLVSTLSGRGLGIDTVLGVLAHSALAVGLVAVSFLEGVRVDLMAYLFGDILAVGKTDVLLVWLGGAGVLGLLWWRWSSLLVSTLSPDLAQAARPRAIGAYSGAGRRGCRGDQGGGCPVDRRDAHYSRGCGTAAGPDT